MTGASQHAKSLKRIREFDMDAKKPSSHFDVSVPAKESGATAPPGQLRLKDKANQSLFMTFTTPSVFSTASVIRQKPVANSANVANAYAARGVPQVRTTVVMKGDGLGNN